VVGQPSGGVVVEPPPSVTTDTSVTLAGGTAQGVTTTAQFTAPTKVTSVGKYLTWQFSGGPAMAGRRVEIWVATRAGTDPWSAFNNRTARIADAAGNISPAGHPRDLGAALPGDGALATARPSAPGSR
jgi:hypothetical protein